MARVVVRTMRAGDLRHRVTIQQKTVTSDPEGVAVETWTEVATVWAAVEPLRGREYIQAAAVTPEVTTRIRMRYRLGVKPAMRVVHGGRVYDVLSVIDVGGLRRELELMCREVP